MKVKNTSAIPLRAAYLRGPYTIHVSCYPSTFDPNRKFEDQDVEGAPQFEPNLKAAGTWDAVIPVPERVREAPTALSRNPSVKSRPSVTWIIEISSQIIFSTSASVPFEVLVGRDEKSVEVGAGGVADFPAPGKLGEHAKRRGGGQRNLDAKAPGVYSDSIKLQVDDTTSLWNSPRFPSWDDKDGIRALEEQHSAPVRGGAKPRPSKDGSVDNRKSSEEGNSTQHKKRKKVHLVVLTHGLHSNLGADMLYMKESIDAAAKQAREDAKASRKRTRHDDKTNGKNIPEVDEEDDDEEVIVRGFSGNAVKTERGLQYLGKRLAKYLLLVTYPDQPYLPVKKPRSRTFSETFGFGKSNGTTGTASHHGSTIHRQEPKHKNYAYQIASISFVGHSLGGLVQTYAIAYIQKHSPEFFDLIKPVNFIALASPFLGLSNENPLYVKFALDFGLVGRTGQDLGLTWSAPAKMRSGWGAMIGGLGADTHKPQGHSDPGSKPLLRILPTGPAHQVLKKFKNRTVYSNVVNDGIVPLRTSCLLFLDWRGLDKVEKARRENGLVGTMAEWTWAELTGANSRSPRNVPESAKVDIPAEPERDVPQPSGIRSPPETSAWTQYFRMPSSTEVQTDSKPTSPNTTPSTPLSSSPFNSLLSLFKPQSTKPKESKTTRIIKRSQTLSGDDISVPQTDSTQSSPPTTGRTRGDSLYEEEGLHAPPKTTFFESAGDLLNPPLPSSEFILDPSSRPRTIFHDRVYHPGDIPPPPPGRQRTLFSVTGNSQLSAPANGKPNAAGDTAKPRSMSSGMKVEEKIARAYHRDLSWRKVLVSLEPDAHNNIIVRRKFANAYGWPVVKHLVDTHFGYTTAATTPDAVEQSGERAIPVDPTEARRGNEVAGQEDKPKSNQTSTKEEKSTPNQTPTDGTRQPPPPIRTDCSSGSSSGEENEDTVPEMTFSPVSAARLALSSPDLASTQTHAHGHAPVHGILFSGSGEELHRPTSSLSRASSMQSSARWTDRYFEEEDEDEDEGLPFYEFERGDPRGHAKESGHNDDGPDAGLKVDTMPAAPPHGDFQSEQTMTGPAAVEELGKGGVKDDTERQPSA